MKRNPTPGQKGKRSGKLPHRVPVLAELLRRAFVQEGDVGAFLANLHGFASRASQLEWRDLARRAPWLLPAVWRLLAEARSHARRANGITCHGPAAGGPRR